MSDTGRPRRRVRGQPTAAPRTTYPPSTSILGTAEQFALLAAWTAGAHADTRRFLLHVLSSRRYEQNRTGDGDAFVPVPAGFIRRYFRRAQPEWLVEAGILEVLAHSRKDRLCREYRVTLALRLQFAEAGSAPESIP